MTARLSTEDAEYLRRSCEESGVPVLVEDPVTVEAAADVLRPASVAHDRR